MDYIKKMIRKNGLWYHQNTTNTTYPLFLYSSIPQQQTFLQQQQQQQQQQKTETYNF